MIHLLSLICSILFSSFTLNHHPIPDQKTNNQPFIAVAQTNNLHLSAPKLNVQVLRLALKAYSKVEKEGLVKNPTLTVIDYSLPSNKQRMWVFNMRNQRLLYKTYVAHGKNSGQGADAKQFSNTKDSKKSSLGTYITQDTYIGHKGYSLNLQGLDKGFNNNAHDRRIVVHGAWYVDQQFINKQGRAGSSWGCPAIPEPMTKPIINTIKNGSVVFAYYPDKNFIRHSVHLMA